MVQSSDEPPTSSPSTASDISYPAADSHSAGLSYLADSDTASEDIPSDTSDDRAFIASETEESSFFSSASSEVSISDICPWCSTRSNVVDAPRDTIMLPVSSITRRIVVEDGHEVEQRLVLWASWE